jgi:hypothetical protein
LAGSLAATKRDFGGHHVPHDELDRLLLPVVSSETVAAYVITILIPFGYRINLPQMAGFDSDDRSELTWAEHREIPAAPFFDAGAMTAVNAHRTVYGLVVSTD